MVRSIIFVIIFWVYQVWLIPSLVYILAFRPRMSRETLRQYGYRTTTGWAGIMMAILKPRISVRGEDRSDPSQPILVVSNHQGEFDIPILLLCIRRPLGFIAKRELARIPLVGKWMEIIGCLFVDRQNASAAQDIIRRGVEALKTGDSLAIFPEGTRSDGPEMRRFKVGFARMAIGAGAVILPVAINHTYKMKARGSYRIQPADVTVMIGDPIPMDAYGEKDALRLTRDVEASIRAQLELDNTRSQE